MSATARIAHGPAVTCSTSPSVIMPRASLLSDPTVLYSTVFFSQALWQLTEDVEVGVQHGDDGPDLTGCGSYSKTRPAAGSTFRPL